MFFDAAIQSEVREMQFSSVRFMCCEQAFIIQTLCLIMCCDSVLTVRCERLASYLPILFTFILFTHFNQVNIAICCI